MRGMIFLFWLCVAPFLLTSTASAQSCSGDASLAFGTVDMTSGQAVGISGTVSVSCAGLPGQVVRACANIGAGSGGSSPSGDRRYLIGAPSGQIDYNLYADSGYSEVWGSTIGAMNGSAPQAIDVTIGAGGTGSGSRTIYGLIYPSQQTVPAGAYSSSLVGLANFFVAAAYATGNPTCTSIGITNQVAGTGSISAVYTGTCTLTVNPLSFGTIISTAAAIDGSTNISVRCSASTPFSILMNGGLLNIVDPTARQLQHGSDRLTYGLFRDNSHSLSWGSSVGVNELTGNGTGLNVDIPVFGQIPAQTMPPSGVYSDIVIVTINY